MLKCHAHGEAKRGAVRRELLRALKIKELYNSFGWVSSLLGGKHIRSINDAPEHQRGTQGASITR